MPSGEETWDGSDLFVPEGTAHVLMTEPVRDALLELGVTNIALERTSEIHRYVADGSCRTIPLGF